MANTKISGFPQVKNNDVPLITAFAAVGTDANDNIGVNVKISGTSLIASLEEQLNLSNFLNGTLAVNRGGTGQTSYVDGDLLIGNTAGTLTKARLTQGTDLSITNGDGSITIDHATVGNTPGTSSTTLNFGDTFDAIDSVTISAQGHLTAQNTHTYTLPSSPTVPTGANPSTNITGTKVDGVATTFMRSDAVPALGSTITIGTGGSARGLVDIEGGNSLDAQLRLNCSAGTHAVVIEGPDHLTGSANYIIKLPHGAPALNKILKVGTYAANAGTYADPSLATMVWADDTDSDTNIYSDNGSLTGARTVTMGSHNLSFASTIAGQEVRFGQNVRIDGQSYTPLETISSTTSWTPDWDNGNVQTMELTGNTTINNPSNIEVGATYIIILKQDAEGSHTVTWGNAYNFPANTPPTLTTGANKADVITLIAYSSTVLMCTSVLDFQTT